MLEDGLAAPVMSSVRFVTSGLASRGCEKNLALTAVRRLVMAVMAPRFSRAFERDSLGEKD